MRKPEVSRKGTDGGWSGAGNSLCSLPSCAGRLTGGGNPGGNDCRAVLSHSGQIQAGLERGTVGDNTGLRLQVSPLSPYSSS